MTESTPTPDPAWSDRPATTGDAAPAATSWSTPTATGTAVTTAQRPGLVTGAGVVLIVMGVLTLIIGLFAMLGAAMFAGAAGGIGETAEAPAGVGNMMGAFAGLIVVFVVLIVGWGILQIVAGVKAMSGRNWARITGIVVAIIGALFALSGLANPEAGASIVISIAIAAAYAFVVFALATSGRWFGSRTA